MIKHIFTHKSGKVVQINGATSLFVPDAEFDLVLRRDAVLAYPAPPLQRQVVERATARVRPSGARVIGSRESLPDDLSEIAPWPGARAI